MGQGSPDTLATLSRALHVPDMWCRVLVLLACVVCQAVASGFKHGDVVSALKRSQYRGYRTAWSELLSLDAPRFGVDKLHKLNPVSAGKSVKSDEEYKVMFSFDDERFLTQWITVSDGRAHYLKFVQFTFEYSGDEIISMKWQVDYHGEENLAQRPEHIFLHYHWREHVEKDVAMGINFLLAVGSVSSFVVAIMVLLGMDGRKRSLHKTA